jgi:hypothetical protein
MAEDLVEKVISFFSGDSSEAMSDKELVLRQRHKELTENKYTKFFKPKTDEADQSLGIFFYSLYKMILPVRVFMKDVAKTTRLRQIVLEAFMDASITETIKQLNPVGIEERSKKTPPTEMAAEINADIVKLTTGFDANRMHRVNRCYNLVVIFFQLANFDYPALLKKFDPNFAEGPFHGEPKFAPVKILHLTKDLSEFLAISQPINPDNDWGTLLKLLKICAGEELISENQFAQMVIGLRDVVNSKVLELIVQYGSKNPIWTCKAKTPDEHVAEAWLELRVAKAQECIDKINETEKNKQISLLLKEIFDSDELVQLENYTVAKGEAFRKRGLTRFTYAEGINYLSDFLSDNLDKGIHELCDILLIRGQWTNNTFSKEMSEAFNLLLELPKRITSLDEALSDDGSEGSRLKAALLRIDRDRSQARYMNSIIDGINDLALDILENAIQHFMVIDKHLKNLAEDVQKKHPEMIVNWRELNSFSKDPLSQQMEIFYKKINYFIQLMQLCAQ